MLSPEVEFGWVEKNVRRPDFENPYSQAVIVRHEQVAKELARKDAAEFSRYLGNLAVSNPGLINEEATELAVERSRNLAFQGAMESRADGYLNDEESISPGIIVYGRLAQYTLLKEVDWKARVQNAPMLLDYELQPVIHGKVALYRLYLPDGGFFYKFDPAAAEGLSIHDQSMLTIDFAADFDNKGCIKRNVSGWRGLLYSERDRVVGTIGKIEGAEGVFWRNPMTEENGIPKANSVLANKL